MKDPNFPNIEIDLSYLNDIRKDYHKIRRQNAIVRIEMEIQEEDIQKQISDIERILNSRVK